MATAKHVQARTGPGEVEWRRDSSAAVVEHSRRFMQTLDLQVYNVLEEAAATRGVSVQGLIRAVIVPAWVRRRGVQTDADDGVVGSIETTSRNSSTVQADVRRRWVTVPSSG